MVRMLLVVALVVPSVSAQATHVVGPGGFAQIRDALAIAQPGDVIEVHPGTYAQFDCTTGVRIRAIAQPVTILYDVAFAPPGCSTTPGCTVNEGASRFSIPLGQIAHVVGLRFDFPTSGLVPARPRVEVAGGHVTFDQCEFRSGYDSLRVDKATVHLQSCTVACINYFTGYSGLIATDSVITVIGGTFTGGSAAVFAGPGGHGIQLVNSIFQGSGFVAQGGGVQTAIPPYPAGYGVFANGGSTWISDAVVQNFHGTACGINASGSLAVARTTFPSGSCSTIGSVLGVLRPSPLLIGTTFALDFRTEPNGFAAVFASPGLALYTTGLFTPEPFLDPAGAFAAGVFLADAAGHAAATWAIPASAALRGLPCWFQGFTGLALPLLASAPAGGIVR